MRLGRLRVLWMWWVHRMLGVLRMFGVLRMWGVHRMYRRYLAPVSLR